MVFVPDVIDRFIREGDRIESGDPSKAQDKPVLERRQEREGFVVSEDSLGGAQWTGSTFGVAARAGVKKRRTLCANASLKEVLMCGEYKRSMVEFSVMLSEKDGSEGESRKSPRKRAESERSDPYQG